MRAVASGDVADLASASDSPIAAEPPPPRRVRRAPRSESRFVDEAAFVLHGYPYKETSLIVDVLTRHHGRVALVARGAKRPRSALRGVLLAFQPLTVSWIQGRARAVAGGQGGNDLRTLTKAEWLGGLRPLRGEALMSGFYLNELVQKLLARDDPHEKLFDAYLHTLGALSEDRPAAPALRSFEAVLLREAGYGVQGAHAADGATIDPLALYRYVPERGPMRITPADGAGDAGAIRGGGDSDTVVVGRTLLDIDADDFSDATTLAQSKRLMRHLLQHHLAGQVLHTRRMV
ncbi:MAG: DNA repair protein RecO, partial [Burkholderiaceae bacterium]